MSNPYKRLRIDPDTQRVLVPAAEVAQAVADEEPEDDYGHAMPRTTEEWMTSITSMTLEDLQGDWTIR